MSTPMANLEARDSGPPPRSVEKGQPSMLYASCLDEVARSARLSLTPSPTKDTPPGTRRGVIDKRVRCSRGSKNNCRRMAVSRRLGDLGRALEFFTGRLKAI